MSGLHTINSHKIFGQKVPECRAEENPYKKDNSRPVRRYSKVREWMHKIS